MEDQKINFEEKIACQCGSTVLKKNLASHVKTKKHIAVMGGPPPLPKRSSGVNFTDAQHSTTADIDDDEEDDDEEDGDDIEELFDMVEEGLRLSVDLAKAVEILNGKIDSLTNIVANLPKVSSA